MLHEIGKGGFGAVYKAIDTQLAERVVAVKEMSHDYLSPQESAEATEHFKQEVFLLARLKHPNLPSIYDYFPEGGRWYVVMDFIEGETLEDYLNRAGNGHRAGGPLNVEEALSIGIALCTVLDYLHNSQPPIIFRDLKPANIMRTSAGQLYLIDFGIARIFKQDKLKDTVALGSPGYAAPEQYGKTQTTPRSDIYALGALLHQLVTGNDPSLTPFIFQPLRLSGYSRLSSLIMQMLEVDANKRPTSTAVVKQTLERLSKSHSPDVPAQAHSKKHTSPGVVATQQYQGTGPTVYVPGQYGSGQSQQQMYQPSQPGSVATPILRRVSRRTVLMVVGGVVVGGGFISYFFNQQGKDASSSQPASVVPPIGIGGDPNLQPNKLPPHAIWSVAWSPNGRYVASGIGTGVIFITDVTNPANVQAYNGHTTAVTAIAWSSNSKLVASASYDQTVQVWEARTSNLVVTFSNNNGPVFGVSWSPDGKHLVSGSYNGAVLVLDVLSGNTMASYNDQSVPISSVAWSPNGRYIAFGNNSAVNVLQAPTLVMQNFYGGTGDAAVQSVAWSPDSKYIALASNDSTVQVWDVFNFSNVYTYTGHTNQVSSAVWSPDGRRIASGSFDKTVQIWDATNGGHAITFKDDDEVTSVAWSPDGKTVVSGDANGNLKWWNIGG
jgi:serine/threonine protein kinase